MARHRAVQKRQRIRWLIPVLAIVLVGGATVVAKLSSSPSAGSAGGAADCPDALTVVAASSFTPVLSAVAPAVAEGANCARLEVIAADGRGAAAEVTARRADVWIPDDAAWAGIQGVAQLAPAPTAGAGTVLASSPFYLVTDAATAARLTAEGGGWLGLNRLLGEPAADPPTRLVVRDPAGSGDGMLAAGALGEAVWIAQDMDASALALARALPMSRTVPGPDPALPRGPGEIGVVPEYALLPALQGDGPAAGATVLAPADHTALLRYSWLPTAAAAADPARAARLDRLREVLTDDTAASALATAGLRGPNATTAPEDSVPPPLPALTAAPYEVLAPHHVDHVFATWYPADRRADVLVAVDVSNSMNAQLPGSPQRVIDLVKSGFADLGRLLPDDSELGLWEFGLRLDPPRDYRALLPSATLTPQHRNEVDRAIDRLRAGSPGTGLYDTVLAAYLTARDQYRPGVANHVVVLTDGRNESDPGALTLEQLSQRLVESHDPARPVQLTLVTVGDQATAGRLEQALKPIDGYVSQPATAQAVGAVFVHVAAGGLHD